MAKPIQVGTCGWSYKEWVGVFYPKGCPSGAFLSHLAEKYPVVEVDSTFYHSPSPTVVRGWRDKTPADFGLSLKVPQTITHEKLMKNCHDEVLEFTDAARILEGKLRCCLLQFGYFNKKAFADLEAFLERLGQFLEAWPKDIPLALEIRNKTWMIGRLVDFLRGHNVALALGDQSWMPSPWSVVQKLDVVTGPFAYLRLLGDRAEVDALTKTMDRIVVDRADQIAADAQTIRLLSERVPVLVFVNNHFAGFAPETIRQLQEELAGGGGK